jgi:DNA primase
MLSQNDIFHYLSLLGIRGYGKFRPGDKWVNFSCPLAPWTHEKGTDRSPSFGISLSEISAYSCYTCHHHGTLSDFAKLYCDLAGGDPSAAINYSREIELGAMRDRADRAGAMRGNDPMGRMWSINTKRYALVQDWSQDFARPMISKRMIARYESDPSHPYLARRGISEKTAKDWGLLIHRGRRGFDRLVFPIYDDAHNLLAYSSRMAWDRPTCTSCGYTGDDISWGMKSKADGGMGCPKCGSFVFPKYMHSKGFSRNLYLYGEHLIDANHRTGVLVEGNLSPIRLYQLGVKNVVATLGSKLGTDLPNPLHQTPGQQLYQAGKRFDELVLIPDVDSAGDSWTRTIIDFFEQTTLGRKKIHVVKLTEAGTDPADQRVSDELLKRLLAPYNVFGS